MDAREGLSPSSRGLQPRAWILGHRALRCQGGARTPVFRVTAGRLSARPPGTDFDRMGTATGIRTPASGLRARCLDLSTIAACGGSGATRTPKGLATPTCFRDRLLIQPDRFHERKGWDSHPQGLSTRTRLANGLLIWPDPFRGALGGIRTHDLVRTGDVLCFLSYKGLASPARFERATPAFGGRCSAPLSYGEMSVDGRSRTCNLRIRKPVPCPFGHVDERATDGIRTRDLRLDGPALQLTELRRLGTRPGSRTQSVPG